MAFAPSPHSDVGLPHPALKAILACDQIIEEAGTGRLTLVRLLDRVTASEFPFDYVRGVTVYVRITDAAGEYAMRMEVVRLHDEETIGEGDAMITAPDRMTPHEFTFDVPAIPCERAGACEFRLFANGRFVGAAVLLVDEEAA